MLRRGLVATVTVLALGLAGCGSDDAQSDPMEEIAAADGPTDDSEDTPGSAGPDDQTIPDAQATASNPAPAPPQNLVIEPVYYEDALPAQVCPIFACALPPSFQDEIPSSAYEQILVGENDVSVSFTGTLSWDPETMQTEELRFRFLAYYDRDGSSWRREFVHDVSGPSPLAIEVPLHTLQQTASDVWLQVLAVETPSEFAALSPVDQPFVIEGALTWLRSPEAIR